MQFRKYLTSIPIIATGIVSMCIYIGVVYAINTWDTGYQAPLWTNTDVTIGSAWWTCQRVYNGGWVATLFVPTKTVAEWNSFNSNKPSGVTTGSCCVPYAGTACDCFQDAYSCQPAPGTPSPGWCTVWSQYVHTYTLDYQWSPATCGTYSAYVVCGQTWGWTYNCAWQCIDDYYGGGWIYECGTFTYNSPPP